MNKNRTVGLFTLVFLGSASGFLLASVSASATPSQPELGVAQAVANPQVHAYLVQRHHSVNKLLEFMDQTRFPENELDGPFHPIQLFSPRTTYLRWTVRFPMNVSTEGTGQFGLQPLTQGAPPQPSGPPDTSNPSPGETVTITQTQTINGQEWTTSATRDYQASSGGGSWGLVSWSAVLDNVPSGGGSHGGTKQR